MSKLPDAAQFQEELELIVADFQAAAPVADGQAVRYPGQGPANQAREPGPGRPRGTGHLAKVLAM